MPKPHEGQGEPGTAGEPPAFDPSRALRTFQQVADGALASLALTQNQWLTTQIALAHIAGRAGRRVAQSWHDVARSLPPGSAAQALALASVLQVAVADATMRVASDVGRRYAGMMFAFPPALPGAARFVR